MSTTYWTRTSPLGVPEDADTAVLGDAANLFGIKRNRDNAVIVAPGAALTNEDGEGLYSYDWTGSGLDPAETAGYTISAKFTKDGLTNYASGLIAATMTGRSLRYLLEKLGRRVGRFSKVTTTEAGVDTNTIKSSRLVDTDTQPGLNTKYRGSYAYFLTGAIAGEQARVKQSGYTPGTGTISVTRPYSVVPPSGAIVGLFGRLPPLDEDGTNGLVYALNQALEVTHHPQRMEIAATTAQDNYALITWPWLTDEDQLGEMFDPNATSTLNPDSRLPSARIRFDADEGRIELPYGHGYATGDIFQVETQVPNVRYIKTSGAWQFSNFGLQELDDETLGDALLIVEVAYYYALLELARITDPKEGRDQWLREAAMQEERAIRVRRARQPRLPAGGYGSAEERTGWRPSMVRSFGGGGGGCINSTIGIGNWGG